MEYFLQQLINGLTLGAIYGLIAIGYTMVYGIIGMINFAHGAQYMMGAFAGYLLLAVLGIGYWPALILAPRHRRDHRRAVPDAVTPPDGHLARKPELAGRPGHVPTGQQVQVDVEYRLA